MPRVELSIADRVQGASAGVLAALPPRVALALSGRPRVRIDGEELDPGIQLLLKVMALRGSPALISLSPTTPERERARISRDAQVVGGRRPTPVASVSELEVAGSRDELRARHYAPRATGAAGPLLVYAHGGGWVVGDLETHDEFCRLICRHAGVGVLSIEYGLAPEHPFPTGVEDVVAAVRWAFDNAASLGADPGRIALGGDSAGGNLSAAAIQLLVKDGGPVPSLQVLIYPSADFVERRRSAELFADGFFLTRESRRWCESRYLPDGIALADPRLSPLRAPDLSGLPPAIVVTAAFDPLRDEGEAYAAALKEAGNRVVAIRVPGMIHGFINMTSANRPARDAVIGLAGMIRAQLASA
jgi:acetyl esterase